MSKVLALLVIAGVVALIATDVVEISFHADRLSNVPGSLTALAKDGSAIERGKLMLVRTSRSVQHLFIHDKERRLELAVLNVNEDADRLSQTLEKGTSDAGVLLPQAELLLSSIKYVRTAAEDAPVDSVAALKEESAASFGKARQVLGQLQELREEYAAIEEEFNVLTRALEDQIGSLELPAAEAKSSDASIPLKF